MTTIRIEPRRSAALDAFRAVCPDARDPTLDLLQLTDLAIQCIRRHNHGRYGGGSSGTGGRLQDDSDCRVVQAWPVRGPQPLARPVGVDAESEPAHGPRVMYKLGRALSVGHTVPAERGNMELGG